VGREISKEKLKERLKHTGHGKPPLRKEVIEQGGEIKKCENKNLGGDVLKDKKLGGKTSDFLKKGKIKNLKTLGKGNQA